MNKDIYLFIIQNDLDKASGCFKALKVNLDENDSSLEKAANVCDATNDDLRNEPVQLTREIQKTMSKFPTSRKVFLLSKYL